MKELPKKAFRAAVLVLIASLSCPWSGFALDFPEERADAFQAVLHQADGWGAAHGADVPLFTPAALRPSDERIPCDLDSFPKLPKLLLIGEAHCDENSREVKKNASELAAQGGFYLGLEAGRYHAVYGSERDKEHKDFGLEVTDESRLYGIESPFPHALIATYLYSFGNAGGSFCDAKDWQKPLMHFLTMLDANPYLRRAYDVVMEAEKGFRGNDIQRLTDKVDRVLAAGDVDARASIRDFDKSDAKRLRKLAVKLNAVYVKAANGPFKEDLKLSEPLKSVEDGADATEIWPGGGMEDLMVAVRNRDMSRNLAGLYCAAAAEGRNVAAIVGAAHAPGMRKWFEDVSGGRIELETGLSFYGSHADEIMKILRKWSAERPGLARLYGRGYGSD